MEIIHNKYNRLSAFFVLAVTFVVFTLTVSPTVSFWDCGEYIGSSYSLGIPHPPGNPLYILLGRVFTIIFFFFKQVAFRVNLISVFSASVTAMLIHLIIVRTMVNWMGIPDTTWKRITVYLSGIVGALYAAFGYTFWFSAVEASVYIPSLLFVTLSTWLAIVWYQSKDPNRDRLLLLFVYIAFLGIGVHMMSMMALIPIFPFVLMSDKSKLRDWRLWSGVLLIASVIYEVSAFLYIAPLVALMAGIYTLMRYKDSRYVNPFIFGILFLIKAIPALTKLSKGSIMAGEFISIVWPFAILLAITLAELITTSVNEGNKSSSKWRFVMYVSAFAILGYSVHIYIPVRSALKPIIDENHPVVQIDKSGEIKWDAFKGFLERKQYGSESMITRMFWRRGSWSKQFGIDGHMGYGGFHITQFFHFGGDIGQDRKASVFERYGMFNGFIILLIYLIPTVMLLFGWYYLYSRNKNIAVLLMMLFLLGSVIMVLYMNFADGFHAEKRDFMYWARSGKQGPMPIVHREVRIRDYFFTGGFMFFGMWIGIAAGCLLHFLFTNKNKILRSYVAPIMVVLFAVSPVLPLTQNYNENNRSGDWVPYDYAYNLLMSCDKDGILITNGDNDTFPLWFLQEAEGIRKDVRIVNLSLLNTKWYIKQLKNLEPKVPITFSDARIDALTHELNPIKESIPYTMSNAGITLMLPGRKEKNALRVQDKMVLHIVDANKWRKPIYFAVTVSQDNMMGLQPFLKMEGLAYRIMPHKVPAKDRIDVDRTVFMLDHVYRFRGLGDRTVPMNETTQKLMSNYAASFIQVALVLREPLINLKNEISILKTKKSETKEDSLLILNELKEKQTKYNDMLDLVVGKLDQCIAIMPWDWRPRTLLQEILVTHGRYDDAIKRIKQARKVEPKNIEYMKMEARIYEKTGKTSEANKVLQELANNDPNPWYAVAILGQNYEKNGEYDKAIEVISTFLANHPGDRRASGTIARLRHLKNSISKTNIKDSNIADTVPQG